MRYTVITNESFADINALFALWQAIEGNDLKTKEDFLLFMSTESLDRDVFIFNTTYTDLLFAKERLVVDQKITG
jgi:hypothetical protein